MKPRNNKSLFATQCEWVEKAETAPDDQVTFFQRASLVMGFSKNAIACYAEEHRRAKTLSEPSTRREFRNIELSTFDYAPFEDLPTKEIGTAPEPKQIAENTDEQKETNWLIKG